MTPHSRRAVPAVPAVPAVLLVCAVLAGASGCGGGGGGDDAVDASGAVPQAGSIPTAEGDQCDIEVEVTGAVETSWSGPASLSTSEDVGPPAFYQASHDGTVVSISSAGNGFEAGVIIGSGSDSFVTEGDGGLDVAADGSGAELDVDATVPFSEDPGDVVHVTASVTC
jgi:hypothetical protein